MLYLYLDIEVYFCLPALGRFFCALKKDLIKGLFYLNFAIRLSRQS